MDSFVQRIARPKAPTATEDEPRSPNRLEDADQAERPQKRPRLDDESQSDRESAQGPSDEYVMAPGSPSNKVQNPEEGGNEDQPGTAFETALPPSQTDREAIEEYEATRASQDVATK